MSNIVQRANRKYLLGNTLAQWKCFEAKKNIYESRICLTAGKRIEMNRYVLYVCGPCHEFSHKTIGLMNFGWKILNWLSYTTRNRLPMITSIRFMTFASP